MNKVVLFKSNDRFETFLNVLKEYKFEVSVLDFEDREWVDFDYRKVDTVIYFPEFRFGTNHPLSLYKVQDNIRHLILEYPHLKIFPDPNIIEFYNDKYRQFLFLKTHNYPTPPTIPLFNYSDLNFAADKLTFPMILKNRFGAGGEAVFKVNSITELRQLFRISILDLFNFSSFLYFFRMLRKRVFYYHLIKEKKMLFPFVSHPLLAQKFVKTDRDLRVIVGNGKVIEAHWRKSPNSLQWKVNIDAGGIGEWSRIPPEIIDLTVKIAQQLKASWVAFDILWSEHGYYITEFSPVWHHYAYKEKPSFIYSDDYNIDVPLEKALDLERLIVESLKD